MSGYLEVKYPFKSNLGLNPFKSWKRQWCILRPNPTCPGGGSLAVYCSEAGAPAGTVELPSGCVVRRAKSRSRPYAFAIFSDDEPRKPRILLAAPTLNDALAWMEKIKDLLNGSKLLGTETLLKDSYSVSIIATELSYKCGLNSDSVVTLSSNGLLVSRSQKLSTVFEWKYINDVLLITENDKNRICALSINSKFQSGGGELKFSGPLAGEVAGALRRALRDRPAPARGPSRASAACASKLSKSEGDLRTSKCSDPEIGEVRRSSWYSGPSEVSLDDIDLVMSKEAQCIPRGQLSRCSGAGDLAPSAIPTTVTAAISFDDCMSDRVSLASGIYEEIPSRPASPSDLYCPMGQDMPDGVLPASAPTQLQGTCASGRASSLEEPTYESVVECVYATMRRARRRPPPPLPPRLPFSSSSKLGSSWARGPDSCVTRHGSLGSLPRAPAHAPAHAPGHTHTRTLPKPEKGRTFSVFRKRLKSDSRVANSPKSETAKENKDVETKKKKFDFTPTRDMFRNFRVGRKPRAPPAARSCECLDDRRAPPARPTKSVECLDDRLDDRFDDRLDDCDADLSVDFDDDAVALLALPQEIVDLILRGRERLESRARVAPESDYLPMSPVVPAPMDHHYMVMSPRADLA